MINNVRNTSMFLKGSYVKYHIYLDGNALENVLN